LTVVLDGNSKVDVIAYQAKSSITGNSGSYLIHVMLTHGLGIPPGCVVAHTDAQGLQIIKYLKYDQYINFGTGCSEIHCHQGKIVSQGLDLRDD
jgi:hypothetical protein